MPKNLLLFSSGIDSHHKVMNAGNAKPAKPPLMPPRPAIGEPRMAARIRCSDLVVAIAKRVPT